MLRFSAGPMKPVFYGRSLTVANIGRRNSGVMMIDIINYLTSFSSLLQFRSETIISYLFMFSMYLSMISVKLPERIKLYSRRFEKINAQ